mgnify:CR=1 FL=1|jgi:hypothetical protein
MVPLALMCKDEPARIPDALERLDELESVMNTPQPTLRLWLLSLELKALLKKDLSDEEMMSNFEALKSMILSLSADKASEIARVEYDLLMR